MHLRALACGQRRKSIFSAALVNLLKFAFEKVQCIIITVTPNRYYLSPFMIGLHITITTQCLVI